ncbi:hypothetical protein [Tenacibaculum sp. nBUS_03]|uniref:hypothetical protein n=1 Tax=Tenacibaculum sp. nBUS_03 TaxID=3395320 RepID=UPI003EBD1DD6
MKYQSQGYKTKKCGQTVLSMITGLPIDVICNEIGKQGVTSMLNDLKPFLQNHGYDTEFKRIRYFEEAPKNSIVLISKQGVPTGHFVLKKKKKYLDPYEGVIHKYNEDINFALCYLKFKKRSVV